MRVFMTMRVGVTMIMAVAVIVIMAMLMTVFMAMFMRVHVFVVRLDSVKMLMITVPVAAIMPRSDASDLGAGTARRNPQRDSLNQYRQEQADCSQQDRQVEGVHCQDKAQLALPPHEGSNRAQGAAEADDAKLLQIFAGMIVVMIVIMSH
jgi:hypothetical protein